MADQKTPEDDKSINDLLKEYASDVKDKDLDDFLKDSGDDAYESAIDEDGDDEDAEGEVVAEGAEERKSSSILPLLLIVAAFGAAGAGAWVYLNRDQGMTSIMGGFMGQDEANAPVTSQMPPPPPLAANDIGAPPSDLAPVAPMPDAPAQPMPIMNEGASDGLPAPGADVLAMPEAQPAASAPAPVAQAAPTPLTGNAPSAATPAAKLPTAGSDANAQDAVSAWNNNETPANTDPTATLPEKPVDVVKAKPVSASKAKTEKPKATAETKPVSEPAPVRAVPKEYVSGLDGALPPPFMAIQARKAMAPAAANTSVAPPAAPVAPATVPSATLNAVPPTFTQPVAAPVTPELRTVPLAINGGRSVPDNTKAYAQIPDTDTGSSPAPSVSAPEAPVAAAPVAISARPSAAPSVAASNGQAAAILAQAQAAEAAGDKDKALTLYTQALEADAVYGDGKSIDRGAVYDRIGAIRSGQ